MSGLRLPAGAVQALGPSGIRNCAVSRPLGEHDEMVQAFRTRHLPKPPEVIGTRGDLIVTRRSRVAGKAS